MASKTKDGKKFEEDVKDSIPSEHWTYRPQDSSSSFSNTSSSRFTNNSHSDLFVMSGINNTLYSLELKSTKEKSIPMCDFDLYEVFLCATEDLKMFRKICHIPQTKIEKEIIKAKTKKLKEISKKCNQKSIKLHQILTIYEDDCLFEGVEGHFLFNFRLNDDEQTYIVSGENFYNWWVNCSKKSINIDDVKEIGVKIKQEHKTSRSKRWKYEFEGIFY